MTELERDLKMAKSAIKDANKKSKKLMKDTLSQTGKYMMFGLDRSYRGAKRVAKIVYGFIKDDEE